MTLGYSTQINGKPTNFVNKIWAGLVMARLVPAYEDVFQKWGRTGREVIGSTPKLHTIRKDKTGRWKAGNQIHNVIHNRTPNRFQFTPVLHCESVQKIEIRNIFDDRNAVIIDGRELAEMDLKLWKIFGTTLCGRILKELLFTGPS